VITLAVRSAALTATLAWFAAVASPRSAGAQGSCSVPHSSPGAVQGNGVSSLQPGSGWIQATLFRLDTREQFGTGGSRERYFSQGHLVTTSLLVTGAVGVRRGAELWAQLSGHALDFREVTGSRSRTGLGDVRLWVRLGPEIFVDDPSTLPVWVGLRGGVKLPGSEFPVDALIIPLTEGQRDDELALEAGRAFHGGAVLVQGWMGRRWRSENTTSRIAPGNEWFAYLSSTVATGPLRWKLVMQTLRGAPYRSFGAPLPTSRRRMFELFPSVAHALGTGQVEVGARFPVAGRNLPAGRALSLSYLLSWR